MKGRKRGCFLPLTFFMLFVCIAGHATDDSDDGEEEDVLGAPLPPLKLGHSICALKADEEFSLKMMLAKMKQEKPDFCFHEKDPGTCRGFFSRYFYNKETKLCEIFKYGGCLGNQNNFKSLEECQTTCQGNSNLLPDAPTEDHPNTVNSSSPEEEHSQFPRIFVNLLPTAPNEKSNIMNSSYPEEEHKQFPRFFEPPAIPSLCMTPMDKGLCRAKETRFFYNYSTGRCRPFHYSGCGGNENNFTSRKSCLRICKKGKMKGRKRGCFLPLTFFMLFVCIAGHATDDSDDGEEEDVLGHCRYHCSVLTATANTSSAKLSKASRVKYFLGKGKQEKNLKAYIGAPLPPLKLGHSICALKADEGPCKAIHIRYYFNIQSRECEIFEYGGCHGNENNFLTLEECQNKCVVTEFSLKMMLAKMKQEKPDFCFHEKDPGTCRGFFSRYFYNKETKLCEIFKYGGCLGNQNNFKSLEECQTTCQGNSNLLPDAPTEDHPNTVNSSSPEEEHSQFPRIFVNLLPTAPNEKSNIMNSSYPEEEHKQFPRFFEPPAIPSLCMTPMDKGLCRAKETRFFYNYSTGRCRPFHYSGCGGNENNFTSRKSCLRICKKGKMKGRKRGCFLPLTFFMLFVCIAGHATDDSDDGEEEDVLGHCRYHW